MEFHSDPRPYLLVMPVPHVLRQCQKRIDLREHILTVCREIPFDREIVVCMIAYQMGMHVTEPGNETLKFPDRAFGGLLNEPP